ncbi:MAG: hypothetical protein OEW88_08245 [Gammaproteobacteria bacterium]|nr:hypothetical protein [Gammaproteobacteria bacterium]
MTLPGQFISIFKDPVANYFADFPFLWDEISIPIRSGSNRQLSPELILPVDRLRAPPHEVRLPARDPGRHGRRPGRLPAAPTHEPANRPDAAGFVQRTPAARRGGSVRPSCSRAARNGG